MRRSLADMVTVITGASAGIGRALAVELSERGGKLVLAARRLDRLEQLNSELGGAHACISADVSQPEACRKTVMLAVEKFGRVDTLVCNAGYGLIRAFDSMSPDDIKNLFQTNLFGTIDCCRAAIGVMKRQDLRDGIRGQIMIVSSACARRGLPYFSTYAASKAAQLSLAEGLRVELKPFGIAVTCVHPELVETDFFTSVQKVSGMNPCALAPGKKSTPASCAHQMARAIERPRRELWPKPFSRAALTICTMIPGVADFFIGRIRDQLLRNNGMLPEATTTPPKTQVAEHRAAT